MMPKPKSMLLMVVDVEAVTVWLMCYPPCANSVRVKKKIKKIKKKEKKREK
jgi:hypothetical protein